jgi:hypothetical protein
MNPDIKKNPHRYDWQKAFYAGMASGVKLGLQRTPAENLAEMTEHLAAEDSRRRLSRIEQLMRGDPDPESKAGRELIKLVTEQEVYEKGMGYFTESGGSEHE